MRVILLENDGNLGALGDVISVKPGYARNYLIPQKKALVATEENLAFFASKKAALEQEMQQAREQAEQFAEKLNGLVCPITAQIGQEGKLFGSITAQAIAQALADLGHDIDKRQIHLPNEPIRTIGEFDITIALHPEIKTTIKIIISDSNS